MSSLVIKFKSDVSLYEKYSKESQEYLDRDFIEPVDIDDRTGSLLLHYPVSKDSATTPLRIVLMHLVNQQQTNH